MIVNHLFDPSRHEPLAPVRWSDATAREDIRHFALQTCLAFSETELWPSHPLDGTTTPNARRAALYDGAGGVIWTLRHLAEMDLIDTPPDFSDTVKPLVARNREWADLQDWQTPSYLLGDTGLLLLQWQYEPDSALEDRLHDAIRSNLDHASQEALWGNPGTAIAAIHMAEATGAARWKQLLQQCVGHLDDSLETDPQTGTPIWTQNLYGKRTRYLGAGHGLVGNTYVALRGSALLDPSQVHRMAAGCLATLGATALRANGCANWHPMSDAARVANRVPPVQDCHGAAGIVNRLAIAPRTSEWDALLLAAGELVWQAGPLAKGPGICHGTAGNALALLKLAHRFQEEVWLDRARAMASHASAQVRRQHTQYGQARHALWTGDLGVAWVLWACMGHAPTIPTLDIF